MQFVTPDYFTDCSLEKATRLLRNAYWESRTKDAVKVHAKHQDLLTWKPLFEKWFEFYANFQRHSKFD